MTQKDKELILKDLSGRIQYGVKCQVYDCSIPYTLSGIIPSRVYQELYFEEMDYKECNGFVDIQYSKPYLFPLSSMTEEQSKIYHELIGGMFGTGVLINLDCLIEFFNRNHLDWRGLIPLGLAIDATGLNIY